LKVIKNQQCFLFCVFKSVHHTQGRNHLLEERATHTSDRQSRWLQSHSDGKLSPRPETSHHQIELQSPFV